MSSTARDFIKSIVPHFRHGHDGINNSGSPALYCLLGAGGAKETDIHVGLRTRLGMISRFELTGHAGGQRVQPSNLGVGGGTRGLVEPRVGRLPTKGRVV